MYNPEANFITPEQEKRQEDFANLLEVIDSVKLDSNIAAEFFSYLNENNLKFKDYFLASVFQSRLLHMDLPEESSYEFYDTDDGKIEAFIKSQKTTS